MESSPAPAVAEKPSVIVIPETNREIHHTHAELQDHVAYNARFIWEKDAMAAAGIASRLCQNALNRGIDAFTYQDAIDSLKALVPVDVGSGRRAIDGKVLNIGVERLISSRLESPEVDMMAADGAWGSLPETVRRHAAAFNADLRIEVTSNCTVGCSFCSFADKGAIAMKASFESIKGVIGEFAGYQTMRVAHRSDILYVGTDPFDMKWQRGAKQVGYKDIAEVHRHLRGPSGRRLYTSTAIPIGEELQVIDFAQHTLSDLSPYPHHVMRLSRTTANSSRLDHILRVLQGLNPSGVARLQVNDVRSHAALRGKRWEKVAEEQVAPWDVVGPNCFDGVVISVRGVYGVIMQGASPERQDGEVKMPLQPEVCKGARRYVFPREHRKADYGAMGLPGIVNMFRDAETITLYVDDAGQLIERGMQVQRNDPHRALLRVMGAIEYYGDMIDEGIATKAGARLHFAEHFASSGAMIREYVASGSANPSMLAALRLLADEGYLNT